MELRDEDEVRCLRWEQVDFDLSVVRFVKTKTDVDRAVPLLGEALQILKELYRQRHPSVLWVFPRPDGRHPAAIESPWTTARRQAGITDFHFPDLRHTYASYLAMSGASFAILPTYWGTPRSTWPRGTCISCPRMATPSWTG